MEKKEGKGRDIFLRELSTSCTRGKREKRLLKSVRAVLGKINLPYWENRAESAEMHDFPSRRRSRWLDLSVPDVSWPGRGLSCLSNEQEGHGVKDTA